MHFVFGGLLLAATYLLAFFLTARVRRYALGHLLDVPNSRSSHRTPTPRGGGLAIVVAFGAAILALSASGTIAFNEGMALTAALPVAAIGFWDDHRSLSARWRLLTHLAAAAWAVYWLGEPANPAENGAALPLDGFAAVLAVIFLAWMLNLFNFMDGIDGLAGAEVGFIAGSASLLLIVAKTETSHAMQLGLLICAATGFLAWNWPPAKIFMGDVGSGFVGFLLGVYALMTSASGELSLGIWLILAGVFIVDASFTLLRRMLSGQRWLQAHRSHAYQRASDLLGGHLRVTTGVLCINTCWLLPLAFAAQAQPRFELGILVLAYIPLVFLAIRLGAGKAA